MTNPNLLLRPFTYVYQGFQLCLASWLVSMVKENTTMVNYDFEHFYNKGLYIYILYRPG